MTILITLLTITGILLQVPDVLTTNKVISQGGREANPLVRWYMDKTGKWWWTSKIFASLPLIYLWTLQGRGADWVVLSGLIAVNAIYVFVVAHNYRQIK